MRLDNLCYVDYSDSYLHLYCYIHNVSVDAPCGLLHLVYKFPKFTHSRPGGHVMQWIYQLG